MTEIGDALFLFHTTQTEQQLKNVIQKEVRLPKL